MLGGTVCRMHGGSAPHVRQAAQRRLLNSADRMAALLLKIAEDKDVPFAVRLAAVKDALDRAGLAPRTGVDVTVETPWLGLVQTIVGEVAAGDVVDAEVVSEEDAEVTEDDTRPPALPAPTTRRRSNDGVRSRPAEFA